jgi:hypothetical protein
MRSPLFAALPRRFFTRAVRLPARIMQSIFSLAARQEGCGERKSPQTAALS